MSRFTLTPTPLAGVTRVERQRLGDHRGFLSRLFCAEELAPAGWDGPIAQINQTYTQARGTIRGMHFQHPPAAEIKLVICLRGAVLDVALDLRAGSPTFLAHHAETLSSENQAALLIPRGCAHGFQALTEDVELLYLHSHAYSAALEGGVSPLDPAIGIGWPLPAGPMSNRDLSHPPLTAAFEGLRV